MKSFLITPLLGLIFSFAQAAPTESALKFQKLKSQSTSTFECEFTSAKDHEKHAGLFRLTAVGENHVLVRFGEQSVECAYDLRSLDMGTESVDGNIRLVALKAKSCLSDSNKKLMPLLNLKIGWNTDAKKPKPSDAEIFLISGEQPQACRILKFDRKELGLIAQRFKKNR